MAPRRCVDAPVGELGGLGSVQPTAAGTGPRGGGAAKHRGATRMTLVSSKARPLRRVRDGSDAHRQLQDAERGVVRGVLVRGGDQEQHEAGHEKNRPAE